MAAHMTTHDLTDDRIKAMVAAVSTRCADPSRLMVFERYLREGKRDRAFKILTKSPVCGARKSDGFHCLAAPLYNGRCRFHGGGTPTPGPKTLEGRQRISEGQRKRWAKWRAERDASLLKN